MWRVVDKLHITEGGGRLIRITSSSIPSLVSQPTVLGIMLLLIPGMCLSPGMGAEDVGIRKRRVSSRLSYARGMRKVSTA